MTITLVSWIRNALCFQALRSWIIIYVCASVVTYVLVLLLLAIGLAFGPFFATQPGGLMMLPVLYLLLWLGPIVLMFAYPSTLVPGVGLLVIAIILAAFGFRVRATSGRILLFSLSAAVWFAAPFVFFLSESV